MCELCPDLHFAFCSHYVLGKLLCCMDHIYSSKSVLHSSPPCSVTWWLASRDCVTNFSCPIFPLGLPIGVASGDQREGGERLQDIDSPSQLPARPQLDSSSVLSKAVGWSCSVLP